MTRYEYALDILKKSSGSGSMLGLERISALVSLLGDPQDRLPVIHVAGTNGKGSFCAMMSAILSEQGMNVGTFNSPAMLSPNDQIRIGGVPVSDEFFSDAVIKAYELGKKLNEPPTEFELVTAAAFIIFTEQKCDFAVVECGMGGDGDATNIIKSPLLSVITNVALDHCAYLGRTASEIARHKAGIIKSGRPVFFGGSDKDALAVIQETAKRIGSKLYTPNTLAFKPAKEITDCTSLIYKRRKYTVPLKGAYQQLNLINVLSCVDILREQGITVDDNSVKNGLMKVRWEGRFELLCNDPVIIFDGAHNPDGMQQLCESTRRYYPDNKPAILIGVLADKDHKLYGSLLKGLVRRAFAVSPDNPRALASDKLAESLGSSGIDAVPFNNIREGLDCAMKYCKANKCPLFIIGSLYMYKDITALLAAK